MMPYRGAPLYESMHDFEYHVERIPGTSQVLKQGDIILPDDPEVRAVMEQFRALWPDCKGQHAAKHEYKGQTGRLMVDLLGAILEGRYESVHTA